MKQVISIQKYFPNKYQEEKMTTKEKVDKILDLDSHKTLLIPTKPALSKIIVGLGNCCISCYREVLFSILDKEVRLQVLKKIADEIALTWFFELGEQLCSSKEFLESNWFEDGMLGDDIIRHLGLDYKTYLPKDQKRRIENETD